MIEPKPCPFCGGKRVDFAEGNTFRWMMVHCVDCGAGIEVRKTDYKLSAGHETNADVGLVSWNSRIEPPPLIKTVFTCEHNKPACPYCAEELAGLRKADGKIITDKGILS